MAASSTVLVPLQLNAFVLNPKLCDPGDSKIAPITQPNYTFLRLTDNLITADVLDHVDLHCVSPANLNSRLTDLGTGKVYPDRIGVYLHWTLPQVYRSGTAAAKGTPNAAGPGDPTATQAERKLQQGYPRPAAPHPSSQPDYSAPEFRPVPNRWVIIRRIDPKSVPKNTGIPLQDAFVVESDFLTKIDSFKADDDIETKATPFINPADLDPHGGRIIDGQAEWFIGSNTPLSEWKPNPDPKAYLSSLTIMTSSNQLFADYVPHNSNVFSIIDNFKFKSGNDTVYLESATADYHVLGWHSKAADDPFTTDAKVEAPLHSERLAQCKMRLKDPDSGSAPTWKDSTTPTRVLCHASLYGVKYSRTALPDGPDGITNLAKRAGTRLITEQPIAIGVTPLDALLAYCRAHADKDASPMSDLEHDILKIRDLLNASENDDVDALQAAADESYEEAFTKFDGGTQWHYQLSTPGPKPAPPPDAKAFAKFNDDQDAYDGALRECQKLRWNLFAQWWKYVSGMIEKSKKDDYKKNLDNLSSDLTKVISRITSLQKLLPNAETNPIPNVQKGARDRFYRRKDPTILFGGIQNGFEADFADALPVRLQDQVVSSPAPPEAGTWDGFEEFAKRVKSTVGLLPEDLQESGLLSMMEFYHLRPANPQNDRATAPQTIPWFHNEPSRQVPETRGRDLWQDTQPWLPLFIEWEADYYHIEYDKWHLKETGRLSHWGSKVLHHGFEGDISEANVSDKRTVSGRVVLTPQAASTLKVSIDQIFRTTNPKDLVDVYGIGDTEKKDLTTKISALDFVSSTMTGLTSGLLTLHEGSHMKPRVRLPNQAPITIDAALLAAPPFTRDMMDSMDIETALTPYGDSVAFETTDPPMKLATHGQLMFTKLNIIDKFGQAICAIPPEPHHTIPKGIPIPTINPCLSDPYFPGTINDVDPTHSDARANTVQAQSDNVACPFVQLTPSINQPARLNAHFVIKDDKSGQWRPCTEWEPPIWGWLVVNYADYGLQFFLADGTFYREVRVGGPTDATPQPKWLPFDAPSKLGPDVQGRAVGQLDFLIAKCAGHIGYMQALFNMIQQSVDENKVHAPNSYATFPSAIIGKPLALVNTGWSLELADRENANWSTVNTAPPFPKLLGRPPNAKPKDYYRFHVKLGDGDRAFDGLVGYFNSSPTSKDPNESDLDLRKIFTYFTGVSSSKAVVDPGDDPREAITTDNFPVFDPYWLAAGEKGADTSARTLQHNEKLQVFGMIMDPFVPIHGYSAVLPNTKLQLPTWIVEEGLKNITAFFHMGPLIVPTDVPTAFDERLAIKEEYASTLIQLSEKAPTTTPAAPVNPADPSAAPAAVTMIPHIQIPVQAQQSWKWLQPYLFEPGVTKDPITGKLQPWETRYNAFDLSPDAAAGQDAQEIRLERGPYTAVEGYLQLVKPPTPAT
jgi:hypothetical protein